MNASTAHVRVREKDVKPGQRFGRLVTVLKGSRFIGNRTRSVWKCICDCGKEITPAADHLVSGHTSSCGCLLTEAIIRKNTKHGQSGKKTRTYRIFKGLNTRCYNSKHHSHKGYGGKGIEICERWRGSFENFFADMGECPEGHSIDRYPDKNGPYSPENCRWATTKQQARNTSRNVLLTIDGETRCVPEWAELYGKTPGQIHTRLSKGWDAKRAVFEPMQPCLRKKYLIACLLREVL